MGKSGEAAGARFLPLTQFASVGTVSFQYRVCEQQSLLCRSLLCEEGQRNRGPKEPMRTNEHTFFNFSLRLYDKIWNKLCSLSCHLGSRPFRARRIEPVKGPTVT